MVVAGEVASVHGGGEARRSPRGPAAPPPPPPCPGAAHSAAPAPTRSPPSLPRPHLPLLPERGSLVPRGGGGGGILVGTVWRRSVCWDVTVCYCVEMEMVLVWGDVTVWR